MGTGTTPGGHDRFPDYDVLDQTGSWDPVTKGVVLHRLGPPPPLRFFSLDEEATCRPLLDRLMGQDEEPRIPLFELIDARLAENETDGWRYEDMPEDGEAWHRSVRHLDEDALAAHGRRFSELDRHDQCLLLEAVRTADRWHDLPAERVWSLWMRYACAAFYSHPWAWNEIGFGGPAYPRGYKALGLDKRENWERPEVDAHDPVPWAERVERARAQHVQAAPGAGGLPSPSQPGQPTGPGGDRSGKGPGEGPSGAHEGGRS